MRGDLRRALRAFDWILSLIAGTFLLFLFMQCCGSGVRVIVHKALQRYTLITYGQVFPWFCCLAPPHYANSPKDIQTWEILTGKFHISAICICWTCHRQKKQASTSAAITFPKWEGLVITKTYYGITQVVGVCIGSLCRDYMIIGICLVWNNLFFLTCTARTAFDVIGAVGMSWCFWRNIQGAFPLGVLILMTFCTYQAVTCQQGGHKIVKVESIPTKAEEDMQTRHKWKWKRQISLNDSRCTPWMRFLLMFAATFNDLRWE